MKTLSKIKTTQTVKQHLSVAIGLIRNIPNYSLYNTANTYSVPQSHTWEEVATELLRKIQMGFGGLANLCLVLAAISDIQPPDAILESRLSRTE